MSDLYLAIDQGGHASRAILFDATGCKPDEAVAPVATHRGPGDVVEHDPGELIASIRDAVNAVTGRAGDGSIAAAGLATQRSSMVCWSRRTGAALSPVISWQDRRNAAWLRQLEPRRDWIRARTGLVLTPHYGASKMRWCLDHLPAVQAAAASGDLCMGPLASYIVFLAIPAAFILGVGRIGNFIDGQIVGSVTTVWWAVKFPDADGFRHPVVLYDGMKNLLIIPVVWYVARRKPATGLLTGLFLLLYAFLRIFVDVFREYPTSLFGLATGQALNVGMSLLGIILILLVWRDKQGLASSDLASAEESTHPSGIALRRMLFAGLLLFSLIMPSDWTQDVPERYQKRHTGLVHTTIYPRIDTIPKKELPKIHGTNPPNQPMQPTR